MFKPTINNNKKRYITIIIAIAIYLFYKLKIRICLIYNIFHVPCVGCGLTRSIVFLLHGDIFSSLKYNLLGIPIVILLIAYLSIVFYEHITNKQILKSLFIKYKKQILIISIVVFIICSIRNFTNILLY